MVVLISIPDLRCAACVAKVEKALLSHTGITQVGCNIATKQVRVSYDPDAIQVKKLLELIQKVGYHPVLLDTALGTDTREVKHLRQHVLLSCAGLLPIALLSMGPMVGMPLPEWLADINLWVQAMCMMPVLWAGRQFFSHGILGVFRTRSATMDTLVALGVGAALLYSVLVTFKWIHDHHVYYETAAFLIFAILFGRYLESITKAKTASALLGLAALQPKIATVIRGTQTQDIPIDDVSVGDHVLVKPGQRIPVDGVVIEGASAVDESMMTGESLPIEKKEGDLLIGGTQNTTGSLVYRATQREANGTLAQMVRLVQEAQSSKAPIQKLADTIAAYFVPAVLVSAAISVLVWAWVGMPFLFVLQTGISILVVSCPCALGLATPTAVIMGTGLAAKRGILIKDATALQQLANTHTVVFDKTGTVTEGKLRVDWSRSPSLPSSLTTLDILRIAAGVNQKSEHPIAKALLFAAEKAHLVLPHVTHFLAKPGKGVEGCLEGVFYAVGNRALMSEYGVSLPEDLLSLLDHNGETHIWVSRIEDATGAVYLGYISISDTIRSDAAVGIGQLQQAGIQVHMLTGDTVGAATRIAQQCGITAIAANVLPKDKDAFVASLKAGLPKGKCLVMVGDGINDAPALAKADVGIAMGGGTDVAIDTADVVLIKSRVSDVATAIHLSKYTLSKIKQNLFWAFFYNVISIPIAAGVLYPITGWTLNPMIAGAAMALSSVSVVCNTLLMKGYST